MSVRACSPTVEDESRILDLMTNVFMTLHLSSAEYLILPPDISHKSDLLRSGKMKKVVSTTDTANVNGEYTNGNVANGVSPTIINAEMLKC